MQDDIRKMMRRDLRRGLQKLQLSVSDAIVVKLIDHAELMLKWNKVCNLSAISAPKEIVTKHILDSLSVAQYVHGSRVIDIGSGNGYPGIPLALIHPKRQYDLVDSSEKKSQFLRHAAATLRIMNVHVVHRRVQELTVQHQYDTVVVRALSSLRSIMKMVHHLLASSGCVLAMKGHFPNEELDELDDQFICAVEQIEVPMLKTQRHLVILKRKTDFESFQSTA